MIYFASVAGSIFLVAAFLKAVYSRLFIIQVRRYRIFPEKLAALLAILFIELEAGWGMALVLLIHPMEMIPATLLLLGLFSGLSAWGVLTGRVNDCGCYGSFVSLNLKQSLAINLMLALLLVAALTLGNPPLWSPDWKFGSVIVVVLIVHFLAKRTVTSPLIRALKLEIGDAWKDTWYAIDDIPGNHRVLFFILESQCSECRKWLERIRMLESNPPSVDLVVLTSDPVNLERVLNQPNSFLKIGSAKAPGFRFLLDRLPMAVLVEQGVIKDVRRGLFPEDLLS